MSTMAVSAALHASVLLVPALALGGHDAEASLRRPS